MAEVSDDNYLIWSHEHGAWWRPKSRGYTRLATEAGIYGQGEALQICAMSRDGWGENSVPSEIPVRQVDVIACQEAFQAAMGSLATS